MKEKSTKGIWKVISASSMGTMMIEWYDFYIFGSLAVVISTKFFLRIIQQQPSYQPWQHLQQGL
jgi:hypothetical protein